MLEFLLQEGYPWRKLVHLGWKSKKILLLKEAHFSKPFEKFWLLNTDSSSLFRPHSPSLAHRGFVHRANNQIRGNKPVDIGYELSAVGLSARQPRYGLSEAPWNLPLSMRLIPFDQNRNSFTATQVNDLLDNTDLPLGSELSVNALDSNYASPEYIAQTHHQANLVNIIRLANNRNVWKQLTPQEQQVRRTTNADSRGAKAIYGQKYKLSEVQDWELPPDQDLAFGIKLAKGRKCLVKVEMWQNMLLRSKRKHNMKDKPFNLVRIDLLDATTEKPLFKRPLWLSIWGQRRNEITLDEIYWAYRNRFDIEHFFRFGKQRLLLDKFQTPDEQQWQNYLEVLSLAYWLLWVAKDEAKPQPNKKWQKYDQNTKNRQLAGLNPSPSEVQQQLEAIILSFEQKPFLPKKVKKGKGRKKGTQFPKRIKHPVRKKTKKKPKTKP